jgi:hypothetical protein
MRGAADRCRHGAAAAALGRNVLSVWPPGAGQDPGTMRCASTTCSNEAADGEPLCADCHESWLAVQEASFPLQQGAQDVQRKRASNGNTFQRSLSVPLPASKQKRDEPGGRELKRSKTVVAERLVAPTHLPILFVPFEGNFSKLIIGGYQRTGNQTSTLVEARGSAPVVQRKGERTTGEDMASTFGRMEFWNENKGAFERMDMLARDKSAFEGLLADLKLTPQQFYETVVEDRLRHLRFEARSTEAEGLPEVIVLSEELLPFPPKLLVLEKTFLRTQTLGTKSHLQDMAAYVAASAFSDYRFSVEKRGSAFAKEPFEETWMLVTKGPFTVACVHLTSAYTKAKSSDAPDIFEGLLSFAQKSGVHAILGDFNLNTFGVHGGVFPVSGGFEKQSTGMAYQSTFATSSGSGTKLYMGGMICDPRVFLSSTLTSLGSLAVPPWFTCSTQKELKEKVFSDHHSLYGNYLFSAETSSLDAPRNEVGGDCFFVALKARLASTDHDWRTKTVLELREAVIDGVAAMLQSDDRFDAGLYVNTQLAGTGFAIGVWCRDRTEFVAQMRLPGRWVDDSILPFIAALLQKKLVIQYAHGHAIFETTGARSDAHGAPPLPADGTFSMKCQGNHFW